MDVQKSEKHIAKNHEQLYFETIFIVDDSEYENVGLESSTEKYFSESSVPVNSTAFQSQSNTNSHKEFLVLRPTNPLEDCIQEEITNHRYNGNLSGFEENHSLNSEPPFSNKKEQLGFEIIENPMGHSKSTLIDSYLGKEKESAIGNSFLANKKKQISTKKKMKLLFEQRKNLNKDISLPEVLNEKLIELNETIRANKKSRPENCLTVNDLPTSQPASKSKDSRKQYTQFIKLKSRQEVLNPTVNKLPKDPSNDLNVDYLKGQIVGASKTLIKTEKSLTVIKKLLHNEVLVGKQTAVKYLREFQYSVNTLRKTMKEIDKRVLNHYQKLVPNEISDHLC